MTSDHDKKPDLELITDPDDETIILDLTEEFDEEWEIGSPAEAIQIKPPQILPEYRDLLPLLPAYATRKPTPTPLGSHPSSHGQSSSSKLSTTSTPSPASSTSRRAMTSAIKEQIAIAIIESGKQNLPKTELCQSLGISKAQMSESLKNRGSIIKALMASARGL